MVERMVERTEQIYMKIEGFYEFFTKLWVKASRHFIDNFGYDDEGTVEERHDIIIFLFIVVLFHFEADDVVERDHLISEIVKKYQWTFQRLHFHRVFGIHLALEPLNEVVHGYVYHL
jgi:hypothetical protein